VNYALWTNVLIGLVLASGIAGIVWFSLRRRRRLRAILRNRRRHKATKPRLHSFRGLNSRGFHRVAYTEWGDADNPHIVICVHGLMRNSRDFDFLATRLADRFRVVCMDVPGRGASDWLEHKDDYRYQLYLADAAALMARVTGEHKHPTIDWIGTSMGGVMGMVLAGKSGSPIRKLVLNDVGPLVPWRGLMRLKDVFSDLGRSFKNLNEAGTYLRTVCASFGPLSAEQWTHVTRHSFRKTDNGYIAAFDPGILKALGKAQDGVEYGINFLSGIELWSIWDRIACPTLVLRGAESDMLTASVTAQMKRRGPKAVVVEFPGIGHAPWLMSEDQTDVIRNFLLQPRWLSSVLPVSVESPLIARSS
jgi:pimeloyl-ACP methyl ester carboxylesterase